MMHVIYHMTYCKHSKLYLKNQYMIKLSYIYLSVVQATRQRAEGTIRKGQILIIVSIFFLSFNHSIIQSLKDVLKMF